MAFLTPLNCVIIWLSGFAILFVIHAGAKMVILPIMNLQNTTRNDHYFKLWWLAVGFWAAFGLPIQYTILLVRGNSKVKE